MTPPTTGTLERVATVLARMCGTLVTDYDVIGTTTRLLMAAADATGAVSGGLILRRPGEDHVNLLAATSHASRDLELYQLQVGQGPCYEAVETGHPSIALTVAGAAEQWPALAAAFERGGYGSLQASPLTWHGEVIGALNLFWREEHSVNAGDTDLLKAFADMATLTIVHAGPLAITTVLRRTRQALDERTVIEQAKGVVAQRQNVSPEAAFAVLLDLAEQSNEMVGVTAARVVREAEALPPAE